MAHWHNLYLGRSSLGVYVVCGSGDRLRGQAPKHCPQHLRLSHWQPAGVDFSASKGQRAQVCPSPSLNLMLTIRDVVFKTFFSILRTLWLCLQYSSAPNMDEDQFFTPETLLNEDPFRSETSQRLFEAIDELRSCGASYEIGLPEVRDGCFYNPSRSTEPCYHSLSLWAINLLESLRSCKA